MWLFKSNKKGLYGNKSVTYLDVMMNSQTYTCDKLHRTNYTHTSTNGEILVSSVICISVNILVMTLYYCFTRCHHCTIMGEECAESITSYNCI